MPLATLLVIEPGRSKEGDDDNEAGPVLSRGAALTSGQPWLQTAHVTAGVARRSARPAAEGDLAEMYDGPDPDTEVLRFLDAD